MDLDQRLRNVAVVGAAGKMGSGIALLLAQEMARVSLLPEHRGERFRLHLIDVNPEALDGLRAYLRAQGTKAAEKSAVMLRELYADRPDLVENFDIIAEHTNRMLDQVYLHTDLSAAAGAHLVFEAIVEDFDVKVSVFGKLKELCSPETFFFTNTSSIPIGLLDRTVGLDGRLIGYHFYNPPAVQKLVEVIVSDVGREDLTELAYELGKRLRKRLIPSNDVAGFIGNGHFMRDGLHAMAEVDRLMAEQGFSRIEAIHAMNRVSQEYLVRPMGIFQLMDYVGIEVFQLILKVMTRHIPGEELGHPLIDEMVSRGVLGGQRSDGSQKDGFLQYVKGRPAAVYDLQRGEYVPYGDWSAAVEERLGPLPEGHRPWRALVRDPGKAAKLEAYFRALKGCEALGCELARRYHRRSREIGEYLVTSGVARCADDVNGVLTNGFFHLYGPINNYLD
jgi:3-hydroxyacyl-CoA dehydrogenase